MAVSAFSMLLLDILLATLTWWLRGNDPVKVLTACLPFLPSSVLLYVAVGAPLAIGYESLDGWSVVLFLLPAFAAHRLFVMYKEQRQLTSDLQTANHRLEQANTSFASALVATLDARDRYTAGHSTTVANLARGIARELDLPPEQQEVAHLAGLLHDIGKVGVPAGILEKPGPLTAEERRLMEEHSEIGERILQNVEAYADIAQIVRSHHERVDGCGYPDRLAGDEIPLISRILCIADAYDAMTSDRPYRRAMPSWVARTRVVEAAGTHFDAVIVEAFDRFLQSKWETQPTAHELDDGDETTSARLAPRLARSAA
jgi:putative nucleotidyltransferase with HDIG domain